MNVNVNVNVNVIEQPCTSPRIIVRVRTNKFRRGNGLCYSREVFVLKRQSEGFDFFNEEISQIGADLTADIITNLLDVEDGIYQVVLTNVRTDWETGYVDGYDFQLNPVQPTHPTAK